MCTFRFREANEVTPSEKEDSIREWLQYFVRKRERTQSQEPEERIKNWIQYFSRENPGMAVQLV